MGSYMQLAAKNGERNPREKDQNGAHLGRDLDLLVLWAPSR